MNTSKQYFICKRLDRYSYHQVIPPTITITQSLPTAVNFMCSYYTACVATITWIITSYLVWKSVDIFLAFFKSTRFGIIYFIRSPLFTPISLPRRVDFPTVLFVIFIPSSSLRYLQAINNQPLPVPAAAAAFTTTIVALAVVRAYSP